MAAEPLLCWACDAPLGETPDRIQEGFDGRRVAVFYCRCREDNRFDASAIGLDEVSPA